VVQNGPVNDDDIDTIHEILAHKKKRKEFGPTLSSYVPNTLQGIKYAITWVYLETIEENKQISYTKVSFLLHQLNQIVQFFLTYFFSAIHSIKGMKTRRTSIKPFRLPI
jgi:hypothetical protein